MLFISSATLILVLKVRLHDVLEFYFWHSNANLFILVAVTISRLLEATKAVAALEGLFVGVGSEVVF